jgi:hypothetical protein
MTRQGSSGTRTRSCFFTNSVGFGELFSASLTMVAVVEAVLGEGLVEDLLHEGPSCPSVVGSFQGLPFISVGHSSFGRCRPSRPRLLERGARVLRERVDVDLVVEENRSFFSKRARPSRKSPLERGLQVGLQENLEVLQRGGGLLGRVRQLGLEGRHLVERREEVLLHEPHEALVLRDGRLGVDERRVREARLRDRHDLGDAAEAAEERLHALIERRELAADERDRGRRR